MFESKNSNLKRLICCLLLLQTTQAIWVTQERIFIYIKWARMRKKVCMLITEPGEAQLTPWLKSFVVKAGGNRLIPSQKVDSLFRSELAAHGVVTRTSLTLDDIGIVTGWFKGVSMDLISPSDFLMHGRIKPQPLFISNYGALKVAGINWF